MKFVNKWVENNSSIRAKTVHTARTMMFEEISRLMNYSSGNNDHHVALQENITGKQTQKNLQRTNAALTRLYELDDKSVGFTCFKYFWNKVEESERPLLAFLFASANDFLLYDSLEALINTPVGSAIGSSYLSDIITKNHPGLFSPNTIASASRNLVSSFRQAGFLTKPPDNLKIKISPGLYSFSFACLIAYLKGNHGTLIQESKWIEIFGLDSSTFRDFAVQASLNDIMEYKFAGSVVTISFNNFFKNLGIYGIES